MAYHYRPQGAPLVVYGQDALDDVPALVGQTDGTGVLLVTSRSLFKERCVVASLEKLLGTRIVGVFSECLQHTPDVSVMAGHEVFAACGASALISLGGGSVIDTAKGIALASAVGGDLAPYRSVVRRRPGGESQLDHGIGRGVNVVTPAPLVPHLAIPTTLSGAEYTDHAGITAVATGIKDQFFHEDMVPWAVVLDPRVTVATPLDLWLSTGIKVLDHVVEIVCSPGSSAASEALCLAALRRVILHLTASSDTNDLAARSEMQIAAWLAVAGYPNQMAGVSHAIDHQLGGSCGVPHGIGACCVLPHSMRFNRDAAADRLTLMADEILRRSNFHGRAPSEVATPEVAISAVAELIRQLGLPTRLRDVGVPSEMLLEIAERAFIDEAIVGNPRRVMSADEIFNEILLPAW
jgi:alcohol dehydrogenase class IV